MEEVEAIVIREVGATNLTAEMNLIAELLEEFPNINISMFPGTRNEELLSPCEFYGVMKRNVDALSLFQLGLTVSNCIGYLGGVWQFNFADIDSRYFAHLFNSVFRSRRNNLAWTTFHGAYDLACLIKILTHRPLPDQPCSFMTLMRHFFGPIVLDLKAIAVALGIHGGLHKIADMSMVECTAVVKSHRAAVDSLLTMHVSLQFDHRLGKYCPLLASYNYNLYGLRDTNRANPPGFGSIDILALM